ncbi:zinc ribbon domain-containing protein [Okeania sp. SIO2B3]|uniref:zinc ribbon domain-containing protein n=1 Tax=Okeania sp. SIO2B3 TaxID=2607784 RepID=UPI0013BFBE9F|nr:zinc ribbon domain-containing protein [Okeania sp. SIO2B3]NET42392.1 transposase [Okeania sp. SIO2B3]
MMRFGGQFLSILAVKAVSAAPLKEANAGQKTIAVNPNGTSQDCSNCGQRVQKKLSERIHSCPHCGIVMCRDQDAARNVKHRAVGHPVLKARACPTEYRDCETRELTLYRQVSVGVCHVILASSQA